MRRARKRDSASSMSAAMSSPTSPMKRKVKWKFPGSTHFAPGTPEHNSDSRSFNSGGKPMPTKRRNITVAHPPTSPHSGKKGQYTGVSVKPIARDLAVGEEADQREVTKSIADQCGFRSDLAEQRRPAGYAADIYTGFRGLVEARAELTQHAAHVLPRAIGISAAEHNRIAGRDLGTEYEPTVAGIDRKQVANEIVPGVRTGNRQAGKDQPADATQVNGEHGPDILDEDRERRPPVDDHGDVVARFVDPVHRPDRRTALGQSGGDGNLGRQHQSGEAVPAESVLPRSSGQQRLRTAVRYETADEESTARGSNLDCRPRQIGAARIGVDQRQGWLDTFHPLGMPARHVGSRIVGGGNNPEAVGRQGCRHHHRRRLIEDLVAA